MMSDIRSDWRKSASEVTSYRGMYRLAEEILVSPKAQARERNAARRLQRTLRDVIEKPIAAAAQLKRARSHFIRLAKALTGR